MSGRASTNCIPFPQRPQRGEQRLHRHVPARLQIQDDFGDIARGAGHCLLGQAKRTPLGSKHLSQLTRVENRRLSMSGISYNFTLKKEISTKYRTNQYAGRTHPAEKLDAARRRYARLRFIFIAFGIATA